MAESFDNRLSDVESSMAEFRDDTDEIRLSEITERIQEVIHSLEVMNNKIEGLNNQAAATRRLVIAIGLAVAVSLLVGIFA